MMENGKVLEIDEEEAKFNGLISKFQRGKSMEWREILFPDQEESDHRDH